MMTNDKALSAAWHAAANVVSLFEGQIVNGLHWPLCGVPATDIDLEAAPQRFADFVRANALAPPESLFRWASGQQLHGADAADFEALPVAYRFAYDTFVANLVAFDNALKREDERQAQAAQAAAGPIYAAALSVPQDERYDALLPDPLATNPNMRLVMIGGDASLDEFGNKKPESVSDAPEDSGHQMAGAGPADATPPDQVSVVEAGEAANAETPAAQGEVATGETVDAPGAAALDAASQDVNPAAKNKRRR
jgi:hypothetical protein